MTGFAVATAFATMTLLGCGSRVVTIGPVTPDARVELPQQSGRLALDLAGTSDVIERVISGFASVEVRGFHRTLRAGFERTFARAFQLAGADTDGALLVVEVSDLDLVHSPARQALVPTADGVATIILVHGTATLSPSRAPRQHRYLCLEFRATLREDGHEVDRVVGAACSHEATDNSKAGLSRALASAVGNLYEQVAYQLFVLHSA